MFLGMLLVCQLMNPDNCTVVTGNPQTSEESCVNDLVTAGIPYVNMTIGDRMYIAGGGCLPIEFRQEPT